MPLTEKKLFGLCLSSVVDKMPEQQEVVFPRCLSGFVSNFPVYPLKLLLFPIFPLNSSETHAGHQAYFLFSCPASSPSWNSMRLLLSHLLAFGVFFPWVGKFMDACEETRGI